MRYLKLVFITLLLLLTTGCVSYSELNELGIIDTILIDKNNNEYTITINVLTPEENNLENSKIYSATNNTLSQCLNDLYLSTTKKISFSHLELLALTPNISRTDYDEIINLFLNRADSRNTFSTIIVSTPDQLMEYKSKELNNLININHEEEGSVAIKQFDSIIKDILEINISYIPRIKIDQEVIIEGYQSIYEENRLLSKEESIGYNFTTDQLVQALFTVDDIGFKVNSSKTNIIVNKNKINLDINNTYQIISNNTNLKEKDIEKKYNQEIKKYINEFLKNNKYNYFYNLIKKYNYKYYQNNNNIQLDFEINIVSSKIDNSNIKGGNQYEQQ